VIAAKLTEQMGGEIGFESEPGAGSNFYFTAWLEKGAEVVHPWMTAAGISCFKKMRAVIVNDNPASRQIVAEYLSSWGVENVAVGSGAEALDILKDVRHDDGKKMVVLIDEQTPDMGAHRLARAIKDRLDAKFCKVIVFSAESASANRAEAADAWITKPMRPSQLFNCLANLSGDGGHVLAATAAATPSGRTDDHQPRWRKDVRVLLVDDNPVNRTIGAQQLSVLGYKPQIADGARRGLEILSNGGADIVLMDCEMPEMDGYAAVAEIRRREASARHTVVIALTAHVTEDERAKCLDAGMDDYLSKPVKLKALADMLDGWALRTHIPAQAPAADIF